MNGDNMKVSKGTFRVKYDYGWELLEGSIIDCFPFCIHRKADKSKDKWAWSITHAATGYSIRKRISLKHAKYMAKALKKYPVFLVPTVETFTLQLEKMKQREPVQHQRLLGIVKGEINE
jgi:hypothetical protein|tara:strand:+ start:136 stop:492 length:357 start_codon:yes stop_codon:yes gene_type:complete